jgi:hypothetical protein
VELDIVANATATCADTLAGVSRSGRVKEDDKAAVTAAKSSSGVGVIVGSATDEAKTLEAKAATPEALRRATGARRSQQLCSKARNAEGEYVSSTLSSPRSN